MNQKTQTLNRFLYSLFYENPKIVDLKMAKIQGSDGRINNKRKIAILNIDSILGLNNM
jgi:hypothetical protein